MTKSILIAYATRYGSTEEIAYFVTRVLRKNGLVVDCMPMGDVDDFEGYDAVVLGSPVNFGEWIEPAVNFVRENQAPLNRVPVVLVTVHIQNLDNDNFSQANRDAYLNCVRPYLNPPVLMSFFHGRFNRRAAFDLLPNWLAWLVPNIDMRHWPSIEAWAVELPSIIFKEQPEDQLLAPPATAPLIATETDLNRDVRA